MSTYKLLGVGNNAKTIKGDGSEYLTAILYMTPYKIMVDGKLFNSCAMAKQASCIDACLYTAGRGQMSNVQTARQRKAEWFYRDRDSFMQQLHEDITKFSAYCHKRGIQPCVRLNGTTDIRWELIKLGDYNIFELHPDVQYYDYTKISNRKCKDIPNYHLTWSYSNANPEYAKLLDKAIEQGMNAAVVYRTAYHKTTWQGYPVVDGDSDDLRFLDPKGGHIVALYAKGKAKKDTSGFVVDSH
tara:strand:+ start:146 stop:871 length:726 start_codon:yes stop_codon:yes gene_type:complete